jgi:hypothetical protein
MRVRLSIGLPLVIRQGEPLRFFTPIVQSKKGLKFVQKYEMVAQKLSITGKHGKRILVVISLKIQYF